MAAGRPELKSILMKQQGAARGQRKQALWHPALRSRKIARFPGGQHRGLGARHARRRHRAAPHLPHHLLPNLRVPAHPIRVQLVEQQWRTRRQLPPFVVARDAIAIENGALRKKTLLKNVKENIETAMEDALRNFLRGAKLRDAVAALSGPAPAAAQ